MNKRICMVMGILLGFAITLSHITLSQGYFNPPPGYPGQIQPHFEQGRNMAITSRIDGQCSGFEPVRIINPNSGNPDTTFLLITPDYYGYGIFDVTMPSASFKLGKILVDSVGKVIDVESVTYSDNIVRIFLVEKHKGSSPIFDNVKIVSVTLTQANLAAIKADTVIHYSKLPRPGVVDSITGFYNVEMLYHLDGKLFIASNNSTLHWFDVSDTSLFVHDSLILSIPSTLPTLHNASSDKRIHEVKGYKKSNGDLELGLGLTRSGMCLITFPAGGGSPVQTYQMYEFDRTTFPDTVINPFKAFYDTLNWSGEHQHKWDWRVCHSVIPYEDESGNEFVLTTDEFANYPAVRRDSSASEWERLDFYWPNYISITLDTVSQVYEAFAHRLNYRHRNRPRYVGEDPNKFQGAFLRIWDRSKLGRNDLTANNDNLILNAYDVQENNSRPEGYVGKNNIPKMSTIPGNGLHEPYLIGNRLYIGAYNSGARILDLRGSQLSVLGYVDSELLLSSDLNDSCWYGRKDLGMYNKGIYRLVPDPYRPGILYGSDNYNGMWLYRFFDSTITDTIRHIPFQTHIEIGTVDGQSTRTFIVPKDVVIDDSAKVKLANNTNVKFELNKKINVNGELTIGSVNFDTSSSGMTPSTIICKTGGKVYFGADDYSSVTVNGFFTMTIDSGGLAVMRSGLHLNFSSGGVIYVDGELQINSATFNDQSRIVCRDGGKVVICPSAHIVGLKHLIIEAGGKLEVKNQSITKVSPQGKILIHGTLDANLSGSQWARFERADTSLVWRGIVIDTMLSSTASQSVLRHVTISGALEGLYIDSAQVTVDSCVFVKNHVGVTINSDSPFFTNNQVDSNTVVGLLGYNMSTVVAHNRFRYNNIGVELYNCGNLWQDNKIDYNDDGLLCAEGVTLPFNRWLNFPQWQTCDSTNGNGIRHNYSGVYIGNLSWPTFECDNSVHDNTNMDFTLADYTSIIGSDNCNDSSSMHWFFGAHAIALWGSLATCNSYDPVLYKNSQPKNFQKPFVVQISDSNFTRAFATGFTLKSQRDYSSAMMYFKDALRFLRFRSEAERVFLQWRQMFIDAKLNKPSDDPMSRGSVAGEIDYANMLRSLRLQSDSVWLKNTATEFLAGDYMRKAKYESALPLYQELASLHTTEADLARRALLALVILHHRGLNDYDSGLRMHNELERLFPRTPTLVFAKIDLGLPLTDEDRAVLTDSIMNKMSVGKNADEAENTANTFFLYPAFPNPFGRTTFGNPRTTIRYRLPASCKVKLTVFTLLGKEIKVIVDREEKEGVYSVEYDGSSIGSGTYIYRLQAEELESGNVRVLERKMTVLK